MNCPLKQPTTGKREQYRERVRASILAALPGTADVIGERIGLGAAQLRMYLTGLLADKLVMREPVSTGYRAWTWRYERYNATRAAIAPPPTKHGRADRDPDLPRCPSCDCGQLAKYANTYSCRHCRHTFAHGDAVTDAQREARRKAKRQRAGSGVIAPRAYRTGYRWGASMWG